MLEAGFLFTMDKLMDKLEKWKIYDMYEKVRACSLVLDSKLVKLKARNPKHNVHVSGEPGMKRSHGEYSCNMAPGDIAIQKSSHSRKQKLQTLTTTIDFPSTFKQNKILFGRQVSCFNKSVFTITCFCNCTRLVVRIYDF